MGKRRQNRKEESIKNIIQDDLINLEKVIETYIKEEKKKSVVEIPCMNVKTEEIEKYEKVLKKKIEFCIEAQVKLPELFSKTEGIKNKVVLRDCEIIDDNTLNIKGLIKEKAHYAAINNLEEDFTDGFIRETIIRIPFEFSTNIPENVAAMCTKENAIVCMEKFNLIDISNDDYDMGTRKGRVFSRIKKKYIVNLDITLLKNQ